MSATPRGPLVSAIVPPASVIGLARDMFRAQCTAWNPSTFANTVVLAAATFTNLPVVNPADMSTGPVLVARSGSGSSLVILGPLATP